MNVRMKAFLVFLAATVCFISAAAANDKNTWIKRILGGNNQRSDSASSSAEGLRWKVIDGIDTMAVEFTATSSEPNADTYMRSDLEDAGGVYEISCINYICGGYMDLSAVYKIEDLPSVASITPSIVYNDYQRSRLLEPKQECDDTTKCCVNEVVGSKFALQIPRILEEFPHLTGKG